MKWHVGLLLLAGCLLAADSTEEANRKDIEKWQGTWQAVAMVKDGVATPAEQLKKVTLTVTGTNYHFRNGDFQEHGTYKFDATKTPKELDITVGDGADKGKVYKVIYAVSADRLTICLEAANKNRPKELKADAGSGCVLEDWDRVKP